MQLPTCTNVRIRSTHDAHKIFLGIQQGLLFMVNRRLDADERLALRSGCVYAWEERGPHTEITGLGIERFTEGRRWSPSRVRDEFLFYYEKYSPPQDGSQNSNPSERQPPRDWDPLVKQTYSVWVDTEKGRRKWHLTAYFTQATVDQLGTVDDIPGVGCLVVPSGLFQSTRVGKNRKVDDSQQRNGHEPLKPAMTSSLPRTFAPFPATYPNRRRSRSPGKSGTPKLYEPYPNVNQTHGEGLYPDSQISQFTIPSASSIAQAPLPPLRDLHQPNFDARRVPSSSQSFSAYGTQDVFNRSSSLVRSIPRAEDTTHRAPELTGGEIKTITRASQSQLSSSIPQRLQQVNSPYLPIAETSTRLQSVPSQPASSWYHSQTAHEAHLDHQSLTFPIRNDMTAPYHIRAPFPSLLDPALSVSTPQQPTYTQPDSLTYVSLQSDPQVQSQHHPYIPAQSHPQTYARLRTTPHTSRLSTPPVSQPSIHSADVDSPYMHTTAFDSHSPDPCGLDNDNRRGSVGPSRVDLAPLHALQRNHPYRRDPVDDRALRMLGPRSS